MLTHYCINTVLIGCKPYLTHLDNFTLSKICNLTEFLGGHASKVSDCSDVSLKGKAIYPQQLAFNASLALVTVLSLFPSVCCFLAFELLLIFFSVSSQLIVFTIFIFVFLCLVFV